MKREHIYVTALAILLCFAYWVMFSGCISTATTRIEWSPLKRQEVSPLIEQRVSQYNNSSRIIKIEGTEHEIVYTVAVKRDSAKAKDLINKK